LAKELGDAHEALDDPPELKENANEIKMDLNNNSIGRKIGNDNPDASPEELSKEIIKVQKEGGLKVLEKPNDNKSNLIPSTATGVIEKEIIEK